MSIRYARGGFHVLAAWLDDLPLAVLAEVSDSMRFKFRGLARYVAGSRRLRLVSGTFRSSKFTKFRSGAN